MTYTFKYQSPLGGIMLASNGEALTGLWFYGQKYFGDTLPEKYEERELSVFNETKGWLDNYFQGKNRILHLRYYLKQRHFEKWFGKF